RSITVTVWRGRGVRGAGHEGDAAVRAGEDSARSGPVITSTHSRFWSLQVSIIFHDPISPNTTTGDGCVRPRSARPAGLETKMCRGWRRSSFWSRSKREGIEPKQINE